MNISDKESHHLRSRLAVFSYDTKCLFCVCLKRNHKGQRNSLHTKLDQIPAKKEVKAKCLERKYTWENEVLACIEYSRDLMAINSVYHQSCSTKFRLGKDPDEDCYEPPAKKRITVSGQKFDIKREDAFCQLKII